MTSPYQPAPASPAPPATPGGPGAGRPGRPRRRRAARRTARHGGDDRPRPRLHAHAREPRGEPRCTRGSRTARRVGVPRREVDPGQLRQRRRRHDVSRSVARRQVTLGQGPQAVAVRLAPFGEAVTARTAPAPAACPGHRDPGGPARRRPRRRRPPPPSSAAATRGPDPHGHARRRDAGRCAPATPSDDRPRGRQRTWSLVTRRCRGTTRGSSTLHGAWHLRDLGSTAGTWLDGRRDRGTGPAVRAPGVRARRPAQRRPTRDRDRGRLAGRRAHQRRRPGPPARGRCSPASRRLWCSSAARRSSAAWQVFGDDGVDDPPPGHEGHGDGAGGDARRHRARDRAAHHRGAGCRGLGRDHRPGAGPHPHQRPRGRPVRSRSRRLPPASSPTSRSENPERLRIDVSDGLDESAEPRFYAEVVAVDGYLDVAVMQIETKLSGAPADEDDLARLDRGPAG